MKLPKDSRLRAFELHGVQFAGETETQTYGRCPFSGKPGKFYVNTESLLWDSKPTGLSGNLWKFLEAKAEWNAQDADLTRLAEDRQLPVVAFESWTVGFDGAKYTIPVRNFKGTVTDIRFYRPGVKGVWTTKGCKPGLLGAERLKRAHPNKPIYICEGEWDAIALQWLFTKLKKGGIVVATPGSAIFRETWADAFQNRDVYLCFDNDAAGSDGEVRAGRILDPVARSVHYLRFPEGTADGYDIRDWVVEWTGKKKPRTGYKRLHELFVTEPRRGSSAVEDASENQPQSAYEKPQDFAEVERVYRKWLFLEDTEGIRVSLATVLSNRIDGDPVWMFLVAPPGGSKTATLGGFGRCKRVYLTSSLTAHSLISGMSFRNGTDPSLIPKLDGKVLIIKDFTSILSLRDNERDEIFGIFRDAYDGTCAKIFGNGVTRRYKSRFSILAAVTPAIYSEGRKNVALGERFLKFTLADNLEHFSEDDIIAKAMDNVNAETEMLFEMQDVVQAFMSRTLLEVPNISPEYKMRIVALAKFGARVRATIARNQYRPDMVEGRPTAEVGTRLGKQLKKLALSLAMVDRRSMVNSQDLLILKKIMIDTVPQRVEDIVRYMYMKCPTADEAITTRDIAQGTRYPVQTISRLMADFNLLSIVDRIPMKGHYWQLTDYVRKCIDDSGVYADVDLSRRRRQRFKRKKRVDGQRKAR